MGNANQRIKNRITFLELQRKIEQARISKVPCKRCGMLGEKHYVQTRHVSLEDIVSEFNGMTEEQIENAFGFWTCPDLYDAQTGRRNE